MESKKNDTNGLCINLEGWDGERDGREVQKWGDICIPMADSCWGLTENSKIHKAIILQLKINKLKKKTEFNKVSKVQNNT